MLFTVSAALTDGVTDADGGPVLELAVACCVTSVVCAAGVLEFCSALAIFKAAAFAIFLETTELLRIGGRSVREGRLSPAAAHSSQNQSPSGITYN